MKCPKCGGEATRDEVDVGVGCIATSPWGCEACRWVDEPLARDLLKLGIDPDGFDHGDD